MKLIAAKIHPIYLVIAAAFSVLVALGAIAAIIWALPRGFDWTDEAWVYSLIDNSRVTYGEPWGYQHVLHPVWELLGETVLAFRILRIVGYVLLGFASAFVFIVFARARGWELSIGQRIVLFAASQIGTMIAFSYPPRYVSYNELASWFSQSIVLLAMLIFVNAKDERTARSMARQLLPWFGIGFLLAMLFGAKITTFAVAGALVFVYWLVMSSWPLSLPG